MKIKALSVLILIFFCSFNSQSIDAKQEEPAIYEVGVAAVDVTPDFPIRLRGYSGRNNESTGIVKILFSNSLMIKGYQEPPTLFITIDN